MTMLDRMRRHKGWLKWSLALVVLAFIVFYIPDFLAGRGNDTAAPGDVVARVAGQDITVGEFRRAYMAQLSAYQRAYGGSLNEQLLRQMGIDQQILRQMIDERAAAAEARRLGLTITDEEIAQRIYAMPAFQDKGTFAGREVYERVLRSATPPLTPAEFETNLRRALLVEKLRTALTDWVSVSDVEIEREYRRRNERVKLELVLFSPDRMREQVTVSDADLAAYFDKHKEQYRVPEKRKIRYLLIDAEALKSKTTIPPGDLERAYQQNIEQYTTPEQVRASHILLKTEGKDEAAVRSQAEALLKQVKSGADFSALAKKHSEDEASAAQGGDLDYFGRGRMVKEFEDVAFALAPGQVSDLVKSSFGFHVIKLTDKKASSTRSFDEVKGQIADQLAWERAQARASETASSLAGQIKRPSDLHTAAKAQGLSVQESGFFTRDEPIMGIGPAPEVTNQAFDLKEGTVAGPVRVARGQVFFTTIGKQDSHLPSLEAVKDRVRDDAVRDKAASLAQSRARELAPAFQKDFASAARTAELESKTTEFIARGATYPDVGVSAELDGAAFSLPVGGVTGPISTDSGTVIAKVGERQDIDSAALSAAKDDLREELLQAQRNRFYSAYMLKAQERLKSEINQDVLRRVVG